MDSRKGKMREVKMKDKISEVAVTINWKDLDISKMTLMKHV